MPAELQTTLDFIRALRVNNGTEWFHGHRSKYEAACDAFAQFIEKDHPDPDLLRYKQFMAEHRFTDVDVLSPDFVDQVVAVCQAIKPS